MAPSARLTIVRTGWLINLLLLALVAALAAYALYGGNQDDATSYPLTAVAASVVKRIVIEPRDGQAIELHKDGDEWFVTRPLRARANLTQVERMLDLLAVRGSERMPAEDLQRFDLDRPALRVHFDDTVIAFGTTNPLSQEQYALVDDSVFMIGSYHRSVVPDRVERVLTHSLLRKEEKPVAFEMPDFKVARVDGKWALDPPQANAPVSQDDFNRWVDDWRYASSLLTQPSSGRAPAHVINVKLEDGRTLQVGVLQQEPELILTRTDEKLTFYFSQDTRQRLLSGPGARAQSADDSAADADPAAATQGSAPVPPGADAGR